jgi:hypothetical protein
MSEQFPSELAVELAVELVVDLAIDLPRSCRDDLASRRFPELAVEFQ